MNQQMQQKIRNSLGELKGRRVLVVGDIGLDEYVMGEVRRISPEAPVPVVEVRKEDQRLGLAANVAQNVVSLGGEAQLVAVIGADTAGERVRGMLKQQGVSDQFLIVDPSRPTIRKLRVMAEHHHVVRVDYEIKRYLDSAVEKKLMQQVAELIRNSDIVIIEDYAKGLLSEAMLQSIIQLAHQGGKRVVLDPHRSTPARFYRGVDLLTPNRDEAVALAGIDADELHSPADIVPEMGKTLREKINAPYLVITRGKDGMSLFEKDKVVHLPTFARQVFDVTGAGDTVIAALALGWSAGWPLEQSCVLANLAAGVVVGKVGCVPCRSEEIVAYIDQMADQS